MPFLKFPSKKALDAAFDVKDEIEESTRWSQEQYDATFISINSRKRGFHNAVWHVPIGYVHEFNKRNIPYTPLLPYEVPQHLSKSGGRFYARLHAEQPELFEGYGLLEEIADAPEEGGKA